MLILRGLQVYTMGGALSQEEKKQLIPHLQDFNPISLSSIVWDTINVVGVDDERENFGIHFDDCEKDEERNVVFWDGDDVHEIPFPVFMEILNLVCKETVKIYEEKYHLEEDKMVELGVMKLKLAMQCLQSILQSLHRTETLEDYRKRIDSRPRISLEKKLSSKHMARARHGSFTWSSGELASPRGNGQKQNRGFESVITRMPELRKRIEVDSNKTLQRVKAKLKVFSLFNNKSAISPKPCSPSGNPSSPNSYSLCSPTSVANREEGGAKEQATKTNEIPPLHISSLETLSASTSFSDVYPPYSFQLVHQETPPSTPYMTTPETL